jgi:hypothetical protein
MEAHIGDSIKQYLTDFDMALMDFKILDDMAIPFMDVKLPKVSSMEPTFINDL